MYNNIQLNNQFNATYFITKFTSVFIKEGKMAINRIIQEKRDEYRVQLINDKEMKITGKNYYCHKVKINDKWEIMQLAHRMMKSDRPYYRR